MDFAEQWTRLKSFLIQTKRVLQVTRKPTREEFRVIAKVTGLGIAAIGALGFVLSIIKGLLIQ